VFTDDVALGTVWAAIPELSGSAIPGDFPRPLRIIAHFDAPDGEYSKVANPAIHLAYVAGLGESDDPGQIRHRLTQYPTARHGEPIVVPGLGKVPLHPVPGYGHLPQVRFAGKARDVVQAQRELDGIAPRYGVRGERYALPAVSPESTEAPHPMVLWWALLLGLSSLARYHPAAWVRAIDVNHSNLAVPIEAALGAGLEAVPRLILSAIRGRPVYRVELP
jgi:hypothetical protein